MKVFIGPSGVGMDLSKFDARPPAQQGDIATAALEGADTLILIDGYFTHTLSPWHKEILFAINNKCRVIGAASLGALRAVECEQYGMEGIGQIFEWYKSGVCTDDADVALSHTHKEDGYTHCSVPIVNLIATVNALNNPILNNAINNCRLIFYPERSWQKIKQVIGKEAHDILIENYIDQKAIDTQLALNLAFQPCGAKVSKTYNTLNAQMISLLNNDITVNGKRKWELSQKSDDAIDLYLMAEMAAKLGICPSSQEIEQQSTLMWDNIGINNPKDAESWLKENNVSGQQWIAFAKKRALKQGARDWYESVTTGLYSVPLALEYQLFNNI